MEYGHPYKNLHSRRICIFNLFLTFQISSCGPVDKEYCSVVCHLCVLQRSFTVVPWEPENYVPDLSALNLGLTVLMQDRFHILTDEPKF